MLSPVLKERLMPLCGNTGTARMIANQLWDNERAGERSPVDIHWLLLPAQRDLFDKIVAEELAIFNVSED